MKRPQRGRAADLIAIAIGGGAILHARPPRDAFAQAEVIAFVEGEMAAILAGDPENPPARDWLFDADRVVALQGDEQLRQMIKAWMRSVIQAERTVERVEGLEEEDGTPCAPSFDLFAALFETDVVELRFRARMLGLNAEWSLEGKDSGRAPNGSSTAGSTSAPAADSTTQRAPEGSASPTQTEAEASALSTNTHQDPPPAESPGSSQTVSAPGEEQASQASSQASTGAP